jgi:hypothetical protein
MAQDNSYGTPIPFGQTTALAQSVIDTAMSLSCVQSSLEAYGCGLAFRGIEED